MIFIMKGELQESDAYICSEYVAACFHARPYSSAIFPECLARSNRTVVAMPALRHDLAGSETLNRADYPTN